jgi:hypothetical protein
VRFRLLALVPLVAAGAVGVIGLADLWPGLSIIDLVSHGAKVVALFGCLVGALSYRCGDLRFRGWGLQAAAFAILILRDAVLHRGLVGDLGGTPVEASLLVLANASSVVGTWWLARAWQGRPVAGDRAAQRAMLRTAAILIALFITAPSLSMRIRELATGSPGALVGVAAVLGDILCLSIVAPVAITALSSRAAGTSWPWTFFTASLFAWLCYDATFMLSALVSAGAHIFWVMGESFRVFACLSAFAAGLAQHWIADHEPRT